VGIGLIGRKRGNNDIRIGLDNVIISKMFDELTANIGVTIVDVYFVLVLLGCWRLVDKVLLQLLVCCCLGH
jgi:hypothetical protein